MVMSWPDGQRDGQPVPCDVVTTCTDFFRIFIQMCFLPFYFVWLHFNPLPIPYDILICFILCRMVSFLCIFGELIYPQFCSHIIHTSVHKLYFIHRVSFCFVYIRKIILHFLLVFRVFSGANSGQNGHFFNPVSSLYFAIRAAGCFDFVFFILSG